MKKSLPDHTRSRERTRAKILETARGLFALKGYHGTSTAEIVNMSGCNKRMLYHYFGDKEGLYKEVHTSQWQEFLEAMQAALEKASELPCSKERLMLGIESYFDYFRGRVDFIRLSMWESLEGGRVLNDIWKSHRGPLSQMFGALVVEAQQDGHIRKEIDAGHLLLSMLGANDYYLAFHETLDEIVGAKALSEEALEKRKVQFLLLMESVLTTGPKSK